MKLKTKIKNKEKDLFLNITLKAILSKDEIEHIISTLYRY
jgi:hypothetical protein